MTFLNVIDNSSIDFKKMNDILAQYNRDAYRKILLIFKINLKDV